MSLECAVDQEGLHIGRQRIREVERLDADARVRQERVAVEIEGRLSRAHAARPRGPARISLASKRAASVSRSPAKPSSARWVAEVQENRIAVGLAGGQRHSPRVASRPSRPRVASILNEPASFSPASVPAASAEPQRFERHVRAGRLERVASAGCAELARGAAGNAEAFGQRHPGLEDCRGRSHVESREARIRPPTRAREFHVHAAAPACDRERLENELQPAVRGAARGEACVLHAERAERPREATALAAELVTRDPQGRAVECEGLQGTRLGDAPDSGGPKPDCAICAGGWRPGRFEASTCRPANSACPAVTLTRPAAPASADTAAHATAIAIRCDDLPGWRILAISKLSHAKVGGTRRETSSGFSRFRYFRTACRLGRRPTDYWLS